MVSELQIEANRKNAKKSSGPKSAAGKMKASRNALCHGLACAENDEVKGALAYLVISYLGDSATEGAAVKVAHAKAKLIRVREVRVGMLAELLKSPRTVPALKRLPGLERYERAALTMQKRALRSLGVGVRLKHE